MFKDKDKQREANRQAQARFKARAKGLTIEGITDVEIMQGITEQASIRATELREFEAVEKASCSEGATGGDAALPKQGVTLTDEEKAARFNTLIADKPKRGKDIKYFGDLSVGVQEDINRMSFVDGKFSETVKANRTAIAINYQHQFPDRYHSTGVVI